MGATITATGANNNSHEFGISVNSTTTALAGSQVSLSYSNSTTVCSTAIHKITKLTNGDVIRLMTQRLTGATAVTVTHMNIFLISLPNDAT
jgi:hypothetical protein